MGIVNSLKTGNVLLDMAIAMMIPIVIGMAFSTLTKAQEMISKVNWLSYFRKPSKQYSRSICHKTIQTPYSTVDMGSNDSQNETLIKAIQLYLHHHNVLQKMNNAKMELQSFGKKEERSYYYYDNDDSKSNSFADTLSKYQVVKKPYSGTWMSIGKFKNQVVRESDDENMVACNGQNGSDDVPVVAKGKGHPKLKFKDKKSYEEYDVDMLIEETKQDVGDGKQSSDVTQKNELTLRFRSDGKHSIDKFIDIAYQWYLNELRKMEDDSRYLYELIEKPLASSSSDEEDNHRKYKRYMLSDEKTFDSLFFQEKKSIVKLVDHFVNKTGKYAIKGYPNKLGLLLHGPPGTGKTSLIKALAQYTNRSIVNVPLARISTNAELSSLFFDQKYYVDGERVPVNLNFKDIIFVMEDVDAVSKIVRRRDGKKTADVTYTEPVDLPTTKSMWKMLVESTNSSCKELVKILMEKSERLATEAKQTSLLCNAAKKMSVVPGINYVGQDPDNSAIKAITEDALKSAQKLMNEYQTVDSFLGTHAQSLKQMIDAGTEVSTEFENELLGLNTTPIPIFSLSGIGPNTQSLSREVSITQDQEQDAVIVDSIKGGGFMKEGEAIDIDDDLSGDLKDEIDIKGSKEKTVGPTFNKWKKDELNLSGLLNVLDGVVDTPGRMLIMTTNHPEVLDPALIRPGRIDKKLLLSYMKYQDIASMIEHYFQTTLSQEEIECLRVAINGDAGTASSGKPCVKLTPAQVEQMAAEYEQVDEMISAIENKSKTILGRHHQLNRVPQVTFNV